MTPTNIIILLLQVVGISYLLSFLPTGLKLMFSDKHKKEGKAILLSCMFVSALLLLSIKYI